VPIWGSHKAKEKENLLQVDIISTMLQLQLQNSLTRYCEI